MSSEQARAPARPVWRRLPGLLVVVAIGLFVALLAYGLGATTPPDEIDERLAEGRTAPAPDFSLELLEGGVLPARLGKAFLRAAADGRISRSELAGTPFVLNIWASWCSPCRDESDDLEQQWRRWGRRGVLFVGLDMQDVRSDARDFLREEGITYPAIRDPGKEAANDYGATGIPETFFVSSRGRVVGHVIGAASSEQIEVGAQAARSGRPAGSRQGGARRETR